MAPKIRRNPFSRSRFTTVLLLADQVSAKSAVIITTSTSTKGAEHVIQCESDVRSPVAVMAYIIVYVLDVIMGSQIGR